MGKNNKEKVKSVKNEKLANISPKWTIANVFMQAIIGGGIIAAFVLTLINIKQQGEFNRNLLRPFVSYEIENRLVVIDDYILTNYLIENSGRTPAYNVKTYSIFSLNKDFPLNEIKEIVSNDTTLYGVTITKGQNISKEIKSLVYGYDGEQIKHKKIIKKLKFERVFYHNYIRYEDNSENEYYLRSTNKQIFYEYNKDKKVFISKWIMIEASEEPL
jgi:hypothetical protein